MSARPATGRSRATRPAEPTEPTPMTTPDRILQAAERLFSERGIDAVSLREITAAADVNIAAVHYHFGSKLAVLEKIFERRAAPIAEQRLKLLADVKRNAAGRPSVEDVLRAFLRPALDTAATSAGGHAFTLLRARMVFEPSNLRRQLLGKFFDDSTKTFIETLATALPGVSRRKLHWGLHFLLGSMVYTMAAPRRVESIVGGSLDTSNTAAALEELVRFAAAGLRGT